MSLLRSLIGTRQARGCSLAMAVVLMSHCLAASFGWGQSKQEQDVWINFGNWRIEIVQENKSLRLVGVVTEGRGAYIAVQCYSERDWYSVEVPIFDPAEIAAADRRGSVRITAWNDRDKPDSITMVRFNKMGAIGLADKSKLAEADILAVSAFAFLDKIQRAGAFFAFEAGGPTRTYDVRHYKAARGKFDESCSAIGKSWVSFLKNR